MERIQQYKHGMTNRGFMQPYEKYISEDERLESKVLLLIRGIR